MIENPMYYCPADDEPDFEVPGIDDCDHLFNASDGESTVYIRVQEHPGEPGIFYASVTVDSDHFTDDLEDMAGPFNSPEDACRALAHHFGWFTVGENGQGEIEFCSDTLAALGK